MREPLNPFQWFRYLVRSNGKLHICNCLLTPILEWAILSSLANGCVFVGGKFIATLHRLRESEDVSLRTIFQRFPLRWRQIPPFSHKVLRADNFLPKNSNYVMYLHMCLRRKDVSDLKCTHTHDFGSLFPHSVDPDPRHWHSHWHSQ